MYANVIIAQTSYTISQDSPVKISVHGTSTLHEWTAKAQKVSDYPEKIKLDPVVGSQIEGFGFSVGSKSLDGGRGSSMNNKISKALLADTHEQITYVQKGSAEVMAKEDGSMYLISNGVLTLAGVEKEISVEVSFVEEDGTLSLTAVKDFAMSDFNIEPPSAMFGQIKTNDDISIQFEFTYQAE